MKDYKKIFEKEETQFTSPIDIIEEFENNINLLDDYFSFMNDSFMDIKTYLQNVDNDKVVDKILQYIEQKDMQYNNIYLELTLLNRELIEFKDKLLEFIVDYEKKIGNTTIEDELNFYKNF